MKESKVPKRQYTEEYKLESARLAQSVGINEAARRLGVPSATLGNWKRRYENNTLAPAGTSINSPCPRRSARSRNLRPRIAACAKSWPAPDWMLKFWEKLRRTSPKGYGEVRLD